MSKRIARIFTVMQSVMLVFRPCLQFSVQRSAPRAQRTYALSSCSVSVTSSKSRGYCYFSQFCSRDSALVYEESSISYLSLHLFALLEAKHTHTHRVKYVCLVCSPRRLHCARALASSVWLPKLELFEPFDDIRKKKSLGRVSILKKGKDPQSWFRCLRCVIRHEFHACASTENGSIIKGR